MRLEGVTLSQSVVVEPIGPEKLEFRFTRLLNGPRGCKNLNFTNPRKMRHLSGKYLVSRPRNVPREFL